MAIANTGIQERGARGLIELKLNGEESNHKHITACQRGRGRGGGLHLHPPPPALDTWFQHFCLLLTKGCLLFSWCLEKYPRIRLHACSA